MRDIRTDYGKCFLLKLPFTFPHFHSHVHTHLSFWLKAKINRFCPGLPFCGRRDKGEPSWTCFCHRWQRGLGLAVPCPSSRVDRRLPVPTTWLSSLLLGNVLTFVPSLRWLLSFGCYRNLFCCIAGTRTRPFFSPPILLPFVLGTAPATVAAGFGVPCSEESAILPPWVEVLNSLQPGVRVLQRAIQDTGQSLGHHVTPSCPRRLPHGRKWAGDPK